MRTPALIVTLCLFGLSISSAQSAQPADICKNDPVYQFYDFAIGNWEVYRDRGGPQKVADVVLTSILNHCAYQETWTVPAGTTGNVAAMFTYSPAQKAWIFAFSTDYADNNYYKGQVIRPGFVQYDIETAMPNGVTRLRHWSLAKLADGRLDEHSERSDDQGKTWSTEYDLFWKKAG